MMRIRCILLGVFMLAGLGALCPTAWAADGQYTGYGLYRHSQPPDWNWAQVNVGAALSLLDTSGTLPRLVFTFPQSALGNPDPRKLRVALVSGTPGATPRAWITPAQPYTIDPNVQSPWASNLLGETILNRAELSETGSDWLVTLTFAAAPQFSSAWDLYLLLDTDGDAKTGFLGGDFLAQNVPLGSGTASELSLAWFELEPGLLATGETTTATLVVQNNTTGELQNVRITLTLPDGLAGPAAPPAPFTLRAREVRRLALGITAQRTGFYPLQARVESGVRRASRQKWLSVQAAHDPRHEFETASGSWFPYPARPTLQQGNDRSLMPVEVKSSRDTRRNLFGVTTHLPRRQNDEDPFDITHVIDHDTTTCWASRWWRTETPLEPEWIQLDFGHEAQIGEIRFLPAWLNSGMPAALKVAVSQDGRTWQTVADATDFKPQQAPAGDPLRVGDRSWQRFSFAPCVARYTRLEAARLTNAHTAFFCAPFDPWQFRVAELAVFDAAGEKVDLSTATVTASTTHSAWYNTPRTVTETWPRLLESGVKLNRIGQWGDKTDWAAVEKTKGVYTIDQLVDHAITESVENGVDILLTLDYGNNLYQQIRDPQDFGPTWHRGHPFLQCAPTTPEAIQGFANYCAFMANHFKGRVKYFEIWNEENGWFFDAWADNGKVEMVRAYGRALKAAAQAIKQANPDAIVCFGGTAGISYEFPRIALEEGAGPYIDLLAFHPYGHATPETAAGTVLSPVNGVMQWVNQPVGIKTYEQEIAAYRKLIRQYNPKGDVWCDEINWFAPGEPAATANGDMSELGQAKHLARLFALNNWLGCASIWWSLYNSNGVQEWAILRSRDLSPRAAYYTAQYMSSLLDDATGTSTLPVDVSGGAPADLMVKTWCNGAGATIIGLWHTSLASDDFVPQPVTVHLGQTSINTAELADTLYGTRQPAVLNKVENGVEIPGLLVGDWPILIIIPRTQTNVSGRWDELSQRPAKPVLAAASR